MSDSSGIWCLRQIRAAHRQSDARASSRVGSIITDYRPTIALKDDVAQGPTSVTAPGAAAPLITSPEVATVIADVAPSVGTVWVSPGGGLPDAAVATAFRVSPDRRRLLTARHVAKALVTQDHAVQTGAQTYKAQLRTAWVAFEKSGNLPAETYKIAAIEWAHAHWDLMLIRLDRDCARPPVVLETAALPNVQPNRICVVGYPLVTVAAAGEQAMTDTIDAADIGRKCVSPGLIWTLPDLATPYATDEESWIRHDASTLPGNSGSPLVSLQTGRVVGLHFLGGEKNAAVYLPRALTEPALLACLVQGAAVGTVTPAARGTGDTRNVEGVPLSAFRGSGEESAAARARYWQAKAVLQDRGDGRDEEYRYRPPGGLLYDTHLADYSEPVATQPNRWSCTGHALAAAVNRQLAARAKGVRGAPRRVSAAMLTALAVRDDEFLDDTLEGSSLRGAIKGFWRTGVCSEALVPATDEPAAWQLTRAIAKDAQNVRLGSYHRVGKNLFHMQAAIAEHGAVLVSAHLHKGWKRGRHPVASIPLKPRGKGEAAHAFLAVGYDDMGFVIQNSWGPAWSAWDKHPGYARWTYEDWEANVIDAWVIQLAPRSGLAGPLPGKGASALPRPFARLPEPRQLDLIGHAAHVESTEIVDYGSLGLGLGGLRETALYLATAEAWEKYPALALLFQDPSVGADAAARLAAATIAPLKAAGIYPFHVFYGLDEFVTFSLRVGREGALVTSRGWQDDGTFLARRAKQVAAPIWERFRTGAAAAGEPGGGLWTLAAALGLEAGRRLRAGKPLRGARDRRRLHVVAFGGGVVAANALAPALVGQRGGLDLDGTGFEKIDSVGLIAPTEAVVPALALRRSAIWLPGGAARAREIPGFSGDWTDLIAGLNGPPSAPPRDASARGFGRSAAKVYASPELREALIAHMTR